jgi:hypothetical protein
MNSSSIITNKAERRRMVGLQIKYCGAKLKDVNLHERMNSTSQSIDCQWMMLVNGA